MFLHTCTCQGHIQDKPVCTVISRSNSSPPSPDSPALSSARGGAYVTSLFSCCSGSCSGKASECVRFSTFLGMIAIGRIPIPICFLPRDHSSPTLILTHPLTRKTFIVVFVYNEIYHHVSLFSINHTESVSGIHNLHNHG